MDYKQQRFSPNDYLALIDRFVKYGDVFGIETSAPGYYHIDPLLQYLQDIMNDPLVQSRVLSSRLAGKVFYEIIGRFVLECLHQVLFYNKCAIGERTEMNKMMEWSMEKRWKDQQFLFQQLEDKYRDDGFDIDFLKKKFRNDGWKNPENWERLKREWEEALDERNRKQLTEKVKAKGGGIGGLFDRTIKMLENKVRAEEATEEQLLEAWEMMDGQWTETEFETKLSIVKVQNKYPEIGEVVRKMGRLPDFDGHDHLAIQTGNSHRMEHSSGSDIEGITIGRDLNALMPFELAQYSDTELEGLFLQ